MALKGNIETFYLSSMLQLLAQDKKTGILTIADKGRMVRVYFKNGTIIYAVGTQKEVRLGYLLRTKGIISAEELQKALTLAKQRKERLGKILVEKSFARHPLRFVLVEKRRLRVRGPGFRPGRGVCH